MVGREAMVGRKPGGDGRASSNSRAGAMIGRKPGDDGRASSNSRAGAMIRREPGDDGRACSNSRAGAMIRREPGGDGMASSNSRAGGDGKGRAELATSLLAKIAMMSWRTHITTVGKKLYEPYSLQSLDSLNLIIKTNATHTQYDAA